VTSLGVRGWEKLRVNVGPRIGGGLVACGRKESVRAGGNLLKKKMVKQVATREKDRELSAAKGGFVPP